MGTHMPGEAFGDALLNAWILGWDADRMLHGLTGLWEAPLFYPAHDTLAWSEHLLGIAVFVAPVYWLTGNVVLAYNVAILGSVVLAGVGAYLLARELTGRADAAWLAGLAFACLPYRAAHLTHLQVLAAGWMPLALLGLHRYFKSGSTRGLALFVAAYVLQALSNGYFLFFLAVPVGIVCIWLLLGRARQVAPTTTGRLRAFFSARARRAAELAVAALLILLMLWPVLHVYLRVRDNYGFARSRGEMVHYSAEPAAYGSITGALRLWRGVLPYGEAERELFPGFGLLFLSVAGLSCLRAGRDARIYAVIAVAGFLLSLGPEPELPGIGRLPTGPYDWLSVVVPGMDGLRVPARFAMVTYLGLSMLGAFGAARILSSLGRHGRMAALLILTATLVAEGTARITTLRFPTTDMSVERAAYEWLRDQPRGPMLEMPTALDHATRYLYRTLTHGNRIVNGYSGYMHGLQGFLSGPPTTEPEHAADLVAAARAIGVRYLVVHRHLYGDRDFAAELVRSIRESPGVIRAEGFGTTSVFELTPPSGDGSWRPDALAVPPAAGDAATAPALPRPHDPPLAIDDCVAAASHNAEAVTRALDGDVATRWLTIEAQRGGEWYSIACPGTQIITEVVLRFDRRSGSNYPRRLVVESSIDGERFSPLWEGSVLPMLTASVARMETPMEVRIQVPPAEFRFLRLRQVSRTRRSWFWAIPEIELRGR